MNFNVYLDDQLSQHLQHHVTQTRKNRNALIREALEQYLRTTPQVSWPQSVQQFEPVPDFPPFEGYRSELTAPRHELDDVFD